MAYFFLEFLAGSYQRIQFSVVNSIKWIFQDEISVLSIIFYWRGSRNNNIIFKIASFYNIMIKRTFLLAMLFTSIVFSEKFHIFSHILLIQVNIQQCHVEYEFVALSKLQNMFLTFMKLLIRLLLGLCLMVRFYLRNFLNVLKLRAIISFHWGNWQHLFSQSLL